MKLAHVRECHCVECQKFDDDEERYREWLRILDEDVIQAEFGYEEGEFVVYPSHWRRPFNEGLTPLAAWQRALDGQTP